MIKEDVVHEFVTCLGVKAIQIMAMQLWALLIKKILSPF